MSKNPFDDDYRAGSLPYTTNLKSYTNTNSNTIEDESDFYEKEIERYMQESLDSTERSRRHLENSEKVGVQTAQDLLEQREKLEKTESNLDQIHATTQITQRNLNSLKSVFGGFFKNKFSKKPKEPGSEPSEMPQSKSAQNLQSTVSNLNAGSSSSSFSGSAGTHTLSDSSRSAIKGSRWEAMDNQIDENLDAMGAQLRNLRDLGAGLGREIEDQNKMLDRIHDKAERNDAIVRSQDAQMKKLLGGMEAKEQQEGSSMTPSVDSSTKLSWAMKAGSFLSK